MYHIPKNVTPIKLIANATNNISHPTPCSPRSTNLHNGPIHTLHDVFLVSEEHIGTGVVVVIFNSLVVVAIGRRVVVMTGAAVLVYVEVVVAPTVVVVDVVNHQHQHDQ